jgi:ribonucleoside-diphosphate reductase alpha chain
MKIKISQNRDEFLTDLSKKTLKDRYLYHDETPQDMFARVITSYADNNEHAQRLYDYLSNLYFSPATPVLANGGLQNHGLPISCFVNDVEDNMNDIIAVWAENAHLAKNGGGIGTYWGEVRSIGEKIGNIGETSGVIPFIKVQDAMTLGVSQGSLRRGSSAAYLDISHPEIETFVELRKPTGGDPNRKAFNIHHGVIITDNFMQAVKQGLDWELKSPHTNEVIETVKARDLWQRILTTRLETGEPYLLFIDTVKKSKSDIYKKLNLDIKTSNLCSEITLTTGKDHLDNRRVAVCCLSSLNLEHFDKWKNDELFIEDIMHFLDNVLQSFIDDAPTIMKDAIYAASRERSIGLGTMGLHAYFQKNNVAFDSEEAIILNKQIFAHIKKYTEQANIKMADEKGACPDAQDAGINKRFTHVTAIAPTASISNIIGTSPSIDPYIANAYTTKTLSGSLSAKNKYLKKLLISKNQDNDTIWSSVVTNDGSVQHLNFLTIKEKSVFRTAFEIDQNYIVKMAVDRVEFIDQAQPINFFLLPDIHKKVLHQLHFDAWQGGIKSIYYCKSRSLRAADKVSHKIPSLDLYEQGIDNFVQVDAGEICESCQ